jgi:hypothetical protein
MRIIDVFLLEMWSGFIWLRIDPMTGFSELGSECLGFIIGSKFLYQLSILPAFQGGLCLMKVFSLLYCRECKIIHGKVAHLQVWLCCPTMYFCVCSVLLFYDRKLDVINFPKKYTTVCFCEVRSYHFIKNHASVCRSHTCDSVWLSLQFKLQPSHHQ